MAFNRDIFQLTGGKGFGSVTSNVTSNDADKDQAGNKKDEFNSVNEQPLSNKTPAVHCAVNITSLSAILISSPALWVVPSLSFQPAKLYPGNANVPTSFTSANSPVLYPILSIGTSPVCCEAGPSPGA